MTDKQYVYVLFDEMDRVVHAEIKQESVKHLKVPVGLPEIYEVANADFFRDSDFGRGEGYTYRIAEYVAEGNPKFGGIQFGGEDPRS